MKPTHIRTLMYTIFSLSTVNLFLLVVTAYLALRPPRIILTPTVSRETTTVAREVPKHAVQHFFIHYLEHLESYTPQTIKPKSNYVLRFIGPNHAEEAYRGLLERSQYVEKSRESCQFLAPIPEEVSVTRSPEGDYIAQSETIRRIYLSDRLSDEQQVRYSLHVRSVLPSETNPFGLEVGSQRVEVLSSTSTKKEQESS